MRCYRCNSVLSNADICESCGADITIYKKIVKMSNSYYNMALAKAKVRDLSGAVDLLKRSVRIDKNNIKARNLLGLIYFEMGECVEAFAEWVISKNIKPEKNMADEYIKLVQSNPNKLDSLNQTIRKFNKALGYAYDGNDDLAIIQLKKILSLNPNFIKAYQLLALLYMKKGEYEKARKPLLKASKIDRNNTLTIKYLNEIDAVKERDTGKKVVKKEENIEDKKTLSGNDVIIPQSSYKETNYALVTFINVIIGIVIGAAMVYFLVTPAKESSSTSEYKATITDYASKLDKLNSSVTTLTEQLKAAETDRDEYKAQAESAASQVANSANIDKLISIADEIINSSEVAAGDFEKEDLVAIADKLIELEEVSLEGESFKNLYKTLCDITYEEAGNYYYNQGAQFSNSNDWDNAVKVYTQCVKINDENPSYLYKLGKALNQQNNGVNTEESLKYLNKVIEIAPDSEYAGYARGYLD